MNWTASRSGNQYNDGGDDDGNEDGDDVDDSEVRRGSGGPAALPDQAGRELDVWQSWWCLC